MGPMAPLRPACLATLTAILVSLLAAVAPALATSKHARHKVKAAVRCGGRPHGKAGSYHAGHAPKRRAKRHSIASAPKNGIHHNTHPRKTPKRSRSSVAVNGSCVGAELQPSTQNIESVRAATLCLVNRERSA